MPEPRDRCSTGFSRSHFAPASRLVVSAHSGVVLIDLAAVERDADADRAARAAAIPAVEAIVAEHRARYEEWLAGAGAADVIRSLRAHVAQARARAVATVPLEHDRRQFERQTRRTMNRVLHRTWWT